MIINKTGAYQSEDLFMLSAPFLFLIDCFILLRNSVISVSYTHLDVYKRQAVIL